MIVELYNKNGQKLTEVKVNEQERHIDGIQWGGNLFMFDKDKNHYRECLIVPAITGRAKQKEEATNE